MQFPRLSAELIEELKKYDTSGFSDAFDELGIQGVITGILPLTPGMKVVGPAVTTRSRDVRPSAPTADLGKVVMACQSGDVVVVDASGAEAGTWGGLMTLIAQNRGVAGVIIDGCTRDAAEIREAQFPCWTTGVVPYSVVTRLKTLSINEPVTVRGVTVYPGDIILADDDGAVVVRPQQLEEVLPRVRAHYEWEQKTKDELRRGIFDSIKKRVT
ncbi:MAG: hypothetical protein HYU86_11090 [Chloroflexi bacterium]|nr:hypothetical protein [Chloroflexota bacterium]